MDNKTALIIDDDESMLEFCSTVLHLDGFAVSSASNGIQALSQLNQKRFDVVLTDHVALPTGRSVTQVVKETSPATEVIVMTGMPTLENAVTSFSQGASNYLAKPFRLEDLRTAIRQCLQKEPGMASAPPEREWLKRVVEDLFLKSRFQQRTLSDSKKLRVYIETDLPDFPQANEKLISLFHEMVHDFKDRMTAASPETTLPLDAGPPSPPAHDHSPIKEIGRYKIIRTLSKRAMGSVYLCRDPQIGRKVAVKTLNFDPDLCAQTMAEIKMRFYREAHAAGKLDHPNIIRIFDAGEERDLAYIAMEYLDGADLSAHAVAKTLLPARKIYEIAATIAEALDYAHNEGVVHRDIKPANVIMLSNGTLRITDFGIARASTASQTILKSLLGTPYYMSPEHVSGGSIDGRADLFSLGVMLFELLTGRRPWREENSIAAILHEIVASPHLDLRQLRPDLPQSVAWIIDKALRKEPENRYQTGREMAQDLEALY